MEGIERQVDGDWSRSTADGDHEEAIEPRRRGVSLVSSAAAPGDGIRSRASTVQPTAAGASVL